MVWTVVRAGTRSMKALSAMGLNDALRRLPQKATSLIGSDIARFLPGYWCFVSTKAGGYIEAAGRLGNAMLLRDITLEDIESLAVGAWVLGTGGGGSPYLGLFDMRGLYQTGWSRLRIAPAPRSDHDAGGALSHSAWPPVVMQ